MHITPRALLASALLLAPLLAPPAWAQGASGNPRYQAAVEQANAFKREGKLKDAAEALRRAQTIAPDPSALYEIATLYEQAGERRAALGYFKRFIDEVPSDARVTEAVARIQALEAQLQDQYEEVVVTSQPSGAYVYINDRANGAVGQTPHRMKLLPGEHKIIAELDGYVTATQLLMLQEGAASQVAISLYSEAEVAPVSFLVNRADAQVYIDKSLMARTPVTEPILVRQGLHQIRVVKPGYAPWEKQVRVAAQTPLTVDVVLQEQAIEGAIAQAAPGGEGGGGGGLPLGPVVTLGTGALFVGGGAYTGFSAQRLYGQLEDLRNQRTLIVASDIDTGNTFVLLTNVLLGLGAAGLTAGGLWWALAPSEAPAARAAPARAALPAAPSAAPPAALTLSADSW